MLLVSSLILLDSESILYAFSSGGLLKVCFEPQDMACLDLKLDSSVRDLCHAGAQVMSGAAVPLSSPLDSDHDPSALCLLSLPPVHRSFPLTVVCPRRRVPYEAAVH